MVPRAFNSTSQKVEAGRFLRGQGQPGLQNELQNSQSYTERHCLRKKNEKKSDKFITISPVYPNMTVRSLNPTSMILIFNSTYA